MTYPTCTICGTDLTPHNTVKDIALPFCLIDARFILSQHLRAMESCKDWQRFRERDEKRKR